MPADEGAESGDDSEEDIVTNYLPGSAGAPLVGREGPTTSSHHLHHHHHHQLLLFSQQQQPQQHQQQAQQTPKPQLTMQHQQQHHHHQQQQQPMVASVLPIHAHAQGPPRRLVRRAEIPTMDSITAESLDMGVSVGPADAFIPPIPTISITPHSPIAHKPFTVLGKYTVILCPAAQRGFTDTTSRVLCLRSKSKQLRSLEQPPPPTALPRVELPLSPRRCC